MRAVTIFGVATFALLVYMGSQGYARLSERTEQQLASTENVARWKQSARALQASNAQWNKRYPSLERYSDQLALVSSLQLGQLGLSTDVDKISVPKAEAVKQNNVDLRLARICLASSADNTSAGLRVTAATYSQLLSGVGVLAQRPNVYIGGMAFDGTGDLPTAVLTDFCILARQGAA